MTNYWNHFLESTSVRKIHSPFVFEFCMHILKDRKTKIGLPDKKDRKSRRKEIGENVLKQDFLFNPKYQRLFQRIVQYYQLNQILEIGDYFVPFTAHYSALGRKPNIISVRKEVVNQHNEYPKDVVAPDLIYIEGCRQEEVIKSCFKKSLSSIRNDSILVLGGIHQAEAMEKTWQFIEAHPTVTLTIDIYHLGFVFFRKEVKEKQNFKLHYREACFFS